MQSCGYHMINYPVCIVASLGGQFTLLSSIYVSRASNFLQESIGSHVTSPNIHLTCNSKLLLVHLYAISSMNHSCLLLLSKL